MFSVIVPIYNVEPYLERCVNSLVNQTWKDLEIILVDDESPDHCPALCDQFAGMDSRIKVIHQKNGGLSAARNSGLRIATKEYVLFVDADDYIALDTCEQFAKFTAQKADILIGEASVQGGICPLEHFVPDKDAVYTGEEYLKEAISRRKSPMAVWLNAYRREFLCDNMLQFKPGILHEDEQFTPRAFLKAQKVIHTGIVFYYYIIREGSITTQKDKRRNAKDFYATCCELEEIYRQLEDSQLRDMLLDLLVEKYLNLFQTGNLYRYGREYLHGAFLRRNSVRRKTKCKVFLMTLSPKLYYHINRMSKRMN